MCVLSGIKAQSLEIIRSKITDFYNKNALIRAEIEDIKPNIQDACVIFKNGSEIRVVAANDNARGFRANVILVDEFRMVDEKLLTTVFKKFLTGSRRPAFVDKVLPDGSRPYEKYEEHNLEIYISSAWYRSHWSWEKFQTFTKSMLNGNAYFVCATPYQLGIKEGILLKSTILDEMKEDTFNEQLFKMEMETIPFGESEKAYFKYELLNKLRQSPIPLLPISSNEYFEAKETGKPIKRDFYRRHSKSQIRILAMDVAIMGSTSKRNNDATVFTEITCVQDGSEYRKTVEYIEVLEGELVQNQALRAKQLFYDLECDYFVIDANGVGSGVLHNLVDATFDSERNIEYPAWTVVLESDDEDTREKCKNQEAVPVIYPIKVSGAHATQTNHEMAVYARMNIQNGMLRLLVSESEASDILMKMPEFKKLDTDRQLDLRSVYVQTTFLINEMINLEAEIKGSYIKLVEPSQRSRKDRYSSLAYGLHYIRQLEQNLKVQDDNQDMLSFFKAYSFFG